MKGNDLDPWWEMKSALFVVSVLKLTDGLLYSCDGAKLRGEM